MYSEGIGRDRRELADYKEVKTAARFRDGYIRTVGHFALFRVELTGCLYLSKNRCRWFIWCYAAQNNELL